MSHELQQLRTVVTHLRPPTRSVRDLGTGQWTHFGRRQPTLTITSTRLLLDNRPHHTVTRKRAAALTSTS
jgi:hypothetical protein